MATSDEFEAQLGTGEDDEAAPEDSGAQGDAGPEAGQQIDKIREIIFGVQMRDYEHRFSQLERDLTDRTERLGEQLTDRMAQMERTMRDELARLGEQLASESAAIGERMTADSQALDARIANDQKALDKRLAEDQQKLEQRLKSEAGQRDKERDDAARRLQEADRLLKEQIASMGQSAGQETDTIRSVIEQNSADFHDALLNLGERLDRALEHAADELEDVKVSRTDLASLLADVATRLRREDGQD